MKSLEALKMLDKIKITDKPAKINPSFTIRQAVDIVRKGIESKDGDYELSPIFEKRVWQVVKNQKRPRY